MEQTVADMVTGADTVVATALIVGALSSISYD
jgi:hypothetical protein